MIKSASICFRWSAEVCIKLRLSLTQTLLIYKGAARFIPKTYNIIISPVNVIPTGVFQQSQSEIAQGAVSWVYGDHQLSKDNAAFSMAGFRGWPSLVFQQHSFQIITIIVSLSSFFYFWSFDSRKIFCVACWIYTYCLCKYLIKAQFKTIGVNEIIIQEGCKSKDVYHFMQVIGINEVELVLLVFYDIGYGRHIQVNLSGSGASELVSLTWRRSSHYQIVWIIRRCQINEQVSVFHSIHYMCF